MTKPRVLFVVEKWAYCNPSYPLSSSHHAFINPLEALGLAEVNSFFFDEVSWISGQKCDLYLENLVLLGGVTSDITDVFSRFFGKEVLYSRPEK